MEVTCTHILMHPADAAVLVPIVLGADVCYHLVATDVSSNFTCLEQVHQARTVLLSAVARSRGGTDEAFVRAVTAACLAGLTRKGSLYVLPPVHCTALGKLIQGQQVAFPGKLVQYLKTETNSKYFQVVGKAPFQVLANLPALITTQHRTAAVQAIISHLTMIAPGGLPPSLAIAASQLSPSQPVRPGMSIDNASSGSSSRAARNCSSAQPSNDVRNLSEDVCSCYSIAVVCGLLQC